MAFLASQAASKRPEYPYPRLLLDCFLAIMCSSFLLTALALHIIVDVHPWYDPQYFIPMLGMVLGNGLPVSPWLWTATPRNSTTVANA